MFGSINKNIYVILALLMSMTMMIAMAGPATAAGCSNPTHQHFISFNSTQTLLPTVATNESTKATSVGVGEETILVADKAADKFSSYNKSSPLTHHSNRHVLAVAFKHRSPSGGWNDVTRQ